MTEFERLNDLRQKVLAGEDVTIEEYTEIIQSLRAKRSGDLVISAEKKAVAKAKAQPIDLDALLGGLGL
jgi:hypothetical protein